MSLRSEIEDTYFRYAWCDDEGDMDGLVGTFAEDGTRLSRVGQPELAARQPASAPRKSP